MRTPTAWPGKGLPCSLQPVLTSRLLPRHSRTWQSGRAQRPPEHGLQPAVLDVGLRVADAERGSLGRNVILALVALDVSTVPTGGCPMGLPTSVFLQVTPERSWGEEREGGGTLGSGKVGYGFCSSAEPQALSPREVDCRGRGRGSAYPAVRAQRDGWSVQNPHPCKNKPASQLQGQDSLRQRTVCPQTGH